MTTQVSGFRFRVFVLALLAALPCLAKIRVAASTTFVGEVVSAIGGDAIDLAVVYPRDADPHAYEPTPRDIARIENRQLVFLNGFGLEATLRGPLDRLNVGTVEVSAGIAPRTLGNEPDPHVWFDPACLATWTTNIEIALTKTEPSAADGFHVRAEKFRDELRKLDFWISEKIAVIPVQRRILVTDHDNLGWFAARYGFKIVGTVLPGFSSIAEPSARELAKLEETIRREKARAIFAEGPATPALIKRVADDTGAKVVILPSESLGPAGSETGTLAGYLQTLTTRIVGGLKQ